MPQAVSECPPETNVSRFTDVDWAVAQVRPNHEKAFVERLPKDIPYALPYSYHRKHSHDTFIPLFPGYVFIGEYDFLSGIPAFAEAKSTRYCSNVIRVYGQEELQNQLSLLLSFLPEKRKTRLEKSLLQNGLKVVTDAGLIGFVEKWEESAETTRVWVCVNTLGRCVSLETTTDNLTLEE